MKKLGLCLLIVLSAAASPDRTVQEGFRASTDAVIVDVSVRDGRRAVVNLTTRDFVLLDDGVPQEVDSVEVAPTGLDLTVVMDVSGSTSPFAAWILGGIRDLRALLLTEDRAELLTVGRQVRASTAPGDDVLRLSPPLIGDGGSHLFDSITAAAMKTAEPGRRHLIVIFTDGLDTRSVIPAETRDDVLRHSNAVIDLFAISTSGRTNSSGVIYLGGPNAGTVETVGDYDYVLQSIADAAGGQFYAMRPGDKAASRLKETIDLFRRHYLLRYRPVGVKSSGWHTLKVTVKSGRYEVVARRGYERSR
jgi:VWFA-related protein